MTPWWLFASLVLADQSSTNTSSSAASSSSTSISINPAAAAGGVSILTPSTTDSVYVKIGNYQTFSWNYTSLSVTPSAVNVELYCSQNDQTYTLDTNRSIDDTMLVWNTTETNEQDTHLITAKYTLRIYNSSGSADDTATGGYLQPLSYVFAVYKPENYDSWANAGKYINAAKMYGPEIAGLAGVLALSAIAFV